MNEEKSSGEVSLLELFMVALRYKWWILASTLVSAILAALFVSYVLHPAWEGGAILEVGQTIKASRREPIEPSANVVARIMQSSFAEGVLKDSGFNPKDLKADPNRFVGSLKATKIKDTELIEVTVRAPSQAMALDQLRASIVYLQKVHLKMMEDTVNLQRKTLEQVTRDIQNNKAEEEVLKKRLLAARDWNAFDATMVGVVLKDKAAALSAMIDRKLLLEEQMGPQNTFTTRVVGDIAVSDGPVSPNKRLIIGLAILLGLLAGMFVAFIHNAITSQSRVN